MLFICYPKCSTCQKAKAYLEAKNIEFEIRDIKLTPPTIDELKKWHTASNLPLKRFFNTSGLVYKSLGLSSKLATLTEEEQYALLASDGMLVKRPLLITDSAVLVGFKEKEWSDLL